MHYGRGTEACTDRRILKVEGVDHNKALKRSETGLLEGFSTFWNVSSLGKGRVSAEVEGPVCLESEEVFESRHALQSYDVLEYHEDVWR